MSIPIQKEVICGNCNATNTFATFGSAGSYGANDLDTRPQGTLRNDMFYMNVQKCFNCGYCNKDIVYTTVRLKEFVSSKKYHDQLSDPEYPSQANEFLCKALINERTQNYKDAALSYLYASWICDDFKKIEQAKKCRTSAIEAFLIDNSTSTVNNKNNGRLTATIVDLHRRNESYEIAGKFCQSMIHKEKDTEILKLLKFQKSLIEKKDDSIYTTDDSEDFCRNSKEKIFFKEFNFDFKENINFTEIKDILGFNTFRLRSCSRPDILAAFNKEEGVAIEIDSKLLAKIKEDSNKALTITKVNRNWPYGEFTTFQITSY